MLFGIDSYRKATALFSVNSDSKEYFVKSPEAPAGVIMAKTSYWESFERTLFNVQALTAYERLTKRYHALEATKPQVRYLEALLEQVAQDPRPPTLKTCFPTVLHM